MLWEGVQRKQQLPMALAKSVNKSACGQVLVAHAYNPSYLEG
jgi:hypothetical protein